MARVPRAIVALAFALLLALDAAGTLLLGTQGRPGDIVDQRRFLLGEATVDLVGLAALRLLLLPLLLLVACRAAARKVATSPAADVPPLLEPLSVNAVHAVADTAAVPWKVRGRAEQSK